MFRAMGLVTRHLGVAASGFAVLATVTAGAAFAAQPQPWQIGMQPAASPVQARIENLHTLLMVIITLITLFVAGLLLWVAFRYNAKRHPIPSRTSHNTIIEVAWTVIPVLILVIIAIPSFRLVYFQDRTADAQLTIKATGHQWYWQYTYPDQGGLTFDSYGITADSLKEGQLRLLAVDNELVVPAGKNIRVLTTSEDVIHSFFIPSLGVQRYAIPGRVIETWFRANEPGVYYGECNQICGTNHDGMPISVKALPEAEFNAWLAQAKTKFASQPAPAESATTANSAGLVIEARR